MTDSQTARTKPPVEESLPTPTDSKEAKPVYEWAPAGLLVLRFALIGFLVWLDLWSKSSVFAWLTENHYSLTVDTHGHFRHLILGEWFTFMESYNNGAAFGQLASVPHLLIGGRVLAVLFLSWMILRAPTTKRVFTAALMLVLAGASGNLWDNLFLEPRGDHPYGAVRDFIDVYFAGIGEKGWHFPTFNVADSCITVGAVLLLLSGFAQRDESDETPPESVAS